MTSGMSPDTSNLQDPVQLPREVADPPSMGPGLVALRPAAPDFERPEPGLELEETADRLEQPGELRGARRQAGRVPDNDAGVGAVFQGRGVACDQRRDVIHPQTIRVDG